MRVTHTFAKEGYIRISMHLELQWSSNIYVNSSGHKYDYVPVHIRNIHTIVKNMVSRRQNISEEWNHIILTKNYTGNKTNT